MYLGIEDYETIKPFLEGRAFSVCSFRVDRGRMNVSNKTQPFHL